MENRLFSLNPRVRNETEHSKEEALGAKSHQEPGWFHVFHISVSISGSCLRPRGQNSAFLCCWSFPSFSPATPSLLITSQMAIPTANIPTNFFKSLAGPPERLRVRSRPLSNQWLLKCGPTWHFPLSRADHSKPSENRQAGSPGRLACEIKGGRDCCHQ